MKPLTEDQQILKFITSIRQSKNLKPGWKGIIIRMTKAHGLKYINELKTAIHEINIQQSTK